MNPSEWSLVVFQRPSVIFLTLLVVLPLLWWRWLRAGRRPAIRFSSLDALRQQGTTWAVRARWIIPALRTLAIALLIVCLARPQKGDEETRIVSEGVAIQMLVDRSSSMMALDFTLGRQRVDRLDAIKSVATDFVQGNPRMSLGGRPDDLIGMITFAGYADTKCPLTLDHGYLLTTLNDLQIVNAFDESEKVDDGTAIGEAIALGVERLRDLDKRRDVTDANRVKSKIMVLLTDGEQNRGDVSPAQGAEIAKALGLKIYTIGVGTRGLAPVPVPDGLGGTVFRSVPVSIDEETLKEVAKLTGGEYFRATDTESLRGIYSRIDELEKTKTEEKRYMQQAELATQAVRIGRLTAPPLILIVIGLLVIEVLLVNTRFRKIP